MKRFFTSFFLAFGLVFLAAQAYAAEESQPLNLRYILYAGGLKVVDVNVGYDLAPTTYAVHANATTRGMWASLVPWRNMITARGEVDENGIHPRLARYDTAWREKLKTIEMSFAEDGSVTTVSTPPQRPDGRVEATPEQVNGTMDPLSAVVNVLARGGLEGCEGKIPAFDGRRVYNLVLTSKGEEQLAKTDYSIFSGTAERCEVTFEPVAGFPNRETRAGFWSARDNAKGNPLIIWMAKVRPGLPLIPVRVQSTVQLGTLVAHLRSVEEQPRATAEAR